MGTSARGWSASALFAVIASVLALCASDVMAFSTYTDCATCHGSFLANGYVSLGDGQSWDTSLMTGHNSAWLSFDCDTCHTSGGFSPVWIDSSDGGNNLPPISCMGCHGREQDVGNDSISPGRGAGLRQHHWNAGVISCADCHFDADPGNYTPVGEDFLPVYYADPDTSTTPPDDPCNPEPDFMEDLLGMAASGLDNDGDGLYDEVDVIDCPEPGQMAVLLLGIGLLLLIDRRRQRSQAR
jgi:hypothetical protein